MRFEDELKEKIADAENGIRAYLPEEKGQQATIFKAMNYSVLAGGKRLRPILMHEMYLMFGGRKEEVVRPFMAAMEMIHTYSLVHDDLPAMDNDDYRRGRLTTHKVYGEDMGILAGDALLNMAFETALLGFTPDCKMENVVSAMQILAKKAGTYGMVGGQVADVENTGKPLSKECLSFIYENKTGALLEASMMIGATLAGATKEQVEVIQQAASKIGLAFQIQDDILDIVGDQAVLGKPIHSDEKNDKTTYVTLYGMEAAKEAVANYSAEAVELMKTLPGDGEFVVQLIQWLIHRDK